GHVRLRLDLEMHPRQVAALPWGGKATFHGRDRLCNAIAAGERLFQWNRGERSNLSPRISRSGLIKRDIRLCCRPIKHEASALWVMRPVGLARDTPKRRACRTRNRAGLKGTNEFVNRDGSPCISDRLGPGAPNLQRHRAAHHERYVVMP